MSDHAHRAKPEHVFAKSLLVQQPSPRVIAGLVWSLTGDERIAKRCRWYAGHKWMNIGSMERFERLRRCMCRRCHVQVLVTCYGEARVDG